MSMYAYSTFNMHTSPFDVVKSFTVLERNIAINIAKLYLFLLTTVKTHIDDKQTIINLRFSAQTILYFLNPFVFQIQSIHVIYSHSLSKMYLELFFFLHFWIVIFILRNLRFGRKQLCIDSWSYIYPAKIICRRHWLYWGWRRCFRIHCFWRLRKPSIIRIEEFRRHFSHAVITAVNVNLVFCCRSFFSVSL